MTKTIYDILSSPLPEPLKGGETYFCIPFGEVKSAKDPAPNKNQYGDFYFESEHWGVYINSVTGKRDEDATLREVMTLEEVTSCAIMKYLNRPLPKVKVGDTVLYIPYGFAKVKVVDIDTDDDVFPIELQLIDDKRYPAYVNLEGKEDTDDLYRTVFTLTEALWMGFKYEG